MTIHLVTFSDESMSRSRELCALSGMRNGCNIADAHSLWTLRQMTGFHKDWETFRGIGYWHWKPIIIRNALDECENSDIVIYADAGVEFINNARYIIDRMDQDIFLFGNNWEHAHWCKADVIAEIMPEWFHLGIPFKQADGSMIKSISPWAAFGKQAQASVIFFRVSDYSRRFVREWLDWCLFESGRLIDDSPSRTPNHPEFREHRHDQAILTTMAYRDGIKLHAWPAVYNRFLGQEFVYSRESYPASDDYPSLFHHHRLRDSEFDALRVTV